MKLNILWPVKNTNMTRAEDTHRGCKGVERKFGNRDILGREGEY